MNKEDKILSVILSVCLIILTTLFLGATVFRPRNVLVRETDKYLYYKEYGLFGLDSAYYKYHKPIKYEGVVSDKSESSRMVGVAGKGRHRYTEYKTTVSYNGKSYTCNYKDTYEDYNKGDTVIVTETFYPRYKINFKHKWNKKTKNY